MSTTNKALFSDFPPVSTEAWEAAIVKALKGKDYEETLVWKTIEGIDVQPYYRSTGKEASGNMPGEAPYRRGIKINNNAWEVCYNTIVDSAANTNQQVLNMLMQGANAINFSGPIEDTDTMARLLQEVLIDIISVRFEHTPPLQTLEHFMAVVQQKKLDATALRGAFAYDPLGHLLRHGNWMNSEAEDLELAGTLLNKVKQTLPHYRSININGQLYHNAGASVVQELAFSLSQGNEYLAQLTAQHISINDIVPRLQFTYAVGSHYFLEIAKLRAARILWSKIVAEYQPASDGGTFIHCESSQWNKTIYDPYVNMLRTTTEAMSATLGGCDSLTLLPFNHAYTSSNEFSERIAKNIHIILQEESYFNKVVDPAAGSYYIETLTDQLAEKAWELFKTVEAKGGLLTCVKAGWIQDEVAKTAALKQQMIEAGSMVVLGVNKYPNNNEVMHEQVAHQVHAPSSGTSVKPLQLHRAAQQLEQERLKHEHANA